MMGHWAAPQMFILVIWLQYWPRAIIHFLWIKPQAGQNLIKGCIWPAGQTLDMPALGSFYVMILKEDGFYSNNGHKVNVSGENLIFWG